MTVLAVDIQKGITDERLHEFDSFIRNVAAIMDCARQNGVEVIHFQHDDGPGSGFSVGDTDFEIATQAKALPGEKVFTKTMNSCFGNRDFARYLEEKGENSLMVIGLQTNFCIDATVKSAFERGYKVIVPQGANSTFDNDYMDKKTTYSYYNEMMWPGRFADCITTEQALSLLNAAQAKIHANVTSLRLRPFILSRDFDEIRNWITDERTHALWSANRIKYPLDKSSFADAMTELAEQCGDSPFVATDENDKPAGFFCYSLNHESGEGMLKFIMVNPALRGQGLGKKMLRLALKYAFEITGAKAMHLNVFSQNVRARRCYEGAGFAERNISPGAFRYKDESWDRCNMIVHKAY